MIIDITNCLSKKSINKIVNNRVKLHTFDNLVFFSQSELENTMLNNKTKLLLYYLVKQFQCNIDYMVLGTSCHSFRISTP